MADNKTKGKETINKNIIDLLYMTPSLVQAKDIAETFYNVKGITVQLWEEMNVLELELSNQNSIDFEPLSLHFKDPKDAAFIKEQNIQSAFLINLVESDLNSLLPYFQQLTDRFSGFVCADSADFTPLYSGSRK